MRHTPGKVYRYTKSPPPKMGSAEYKFREALVKDGILNAVDDDLVRKDRQPSHFRISEVFAKNGDTKENIDRPEWPKWKKSVFITFKVVGWLVWLGVLIFLVYTFVKGTYF